MDSTRKTGRTAYIGDRGAIGVRKAFVEPPQVATVIEHGPDATDHRKVAVGARSTEDAA